MPLDPSGVTPLASPTASPEAPPSTNPALQLAGALQDASPEVNSFLLQYGQQEKAKAEARAFGDAMRGSSANYAEAVRTGKIAGAQSPWYVQAYDRDRAQVRTEQGMASIVGDSQSWAERNDPAAYEDRLNKEAGSLFQQVGQGMHATDAQAGFNAGAAPVLSQAIQANHAYNIQRIGQERADNSVTLASQAVVQASKANGGAPTTDQVFAAMEPFHQSWISTGGTETTWAGNALKAVVNAGAITGNSALLDSLMDDRGGKGALASMAKDAWGKPEAINIDNYKRYIDQSATSGANSEARRQAAAWKAEGQSGYMALMSGPPGWAYLKGEKSYAETVQALQDQGLSPIGAQQAIKLLKEDVGADSALASGLLDTRSVNPERQLDYARLVEKAARNGSSSSLDSDLEAGIRGGRISGQQAGTIIERAQSTDHHNESDARSDARQARSDARAAASAARATAVDDRRARLEAAKDHNDYKDGAFGTAVTTLEALGDRSLSTDPKLAASVKVRLNAASEARLHAHPGDYAGAQAAVDAELNSVLAPRVAAAAKRRAAPSGPPSGAPPTANPRGTN